MAYVSFKRKTFVDRRRERAARPSGNYTVSPTGRSYPYLPEFWHYVHKLQQCPKSDVWYSNPVDLDQLGGKHASLAAVDYGKLEGRVLAHFMPSKGQQSKAVSPRKTPRVDHWDLDRIDDDYWWNWNK